MSYILDALRKAERDRNVGRVPTLADVTHIEMEPAAPPRSRRILVFGVVVLLAMVAAYIINTRLSEQSAAEPPEETEAPAEETADEPPAVTEEASGTAIAEAAPALDPDSDQSSLDELMDTAPTPEADDGPAAETALGESAQEEFFEVQDEPQTAADDGAKAPENRAVESAVIDSALPLREMPSDYRSAFPRLRVDVHVYDADVARRWVLINGKKYQEGATLPEGPRIAQITAEGIVFDFRGKTALLPLNR